MSNLTMEQRVRELLDQLTLSEKVSLLSGKDAWNTVPVERLGIPSLTMTRISIAIQLITCNRLEFLKTSWNDIKLTSG